MIRPGNSSENNNAVIRQNRPLEPGVVIVAEIAFAAVLLYLANHPVELNDLSQANSVVANSNTQQSSAVGNQSEGRDDLLTKQKINDQLDEQITDISHHLDSEFETPEGVAVAATSISNETTINN